MLDDSDLNSFLEKTLEKNGESTEHKKNSSNSDPGNSRLNLKNATLITIPAAFTKICKSFDLMSNHNFFFNSFVCLFLNFILLFLFFFKDKEVK